MNKKQYKTNLRLNNGAVLRFVSHHEKCTQKQVEKDNEIKKNIQTLIMST